MSPLLIAALLLPALACGAPDAVASWSFDEDPAGAIVDSGPSALHGTLLGARYVEGPGGVGLGLSFRNGGRAVFPPAAYLANDEQGFSLRFWVRATRTATKRTILAVSDPQSGSVVFALGLDSEGRLALTPRGAPDGALVGRRRLDDGLWHYVAAAYCADRRCVLLFVDDQIEARGEADGSLAGRVLGIALGSGPDGREPYTGDLDDLEIAQGLPEDLARVMSIREQFVVLDPGTARRALAAYRARLALDAVGPGESARAVVLPSLTGISSAEEARAAVHELRQAVAGMVAGPAGIPGLAVNPGTAFDLEEYRAEPLIVTIEAEIPVPAVIFRQAQWNGGEAEPGPVVILLDEAGKADAAGYHWRLITGLADAGITVCLADPRAVGELAGAWDMPGRPSWAAGGWDVAALAGYLAARPDVLPGRVVCVAFGSSTLPAVAAAMIQPAIARTVLAPGTAPGMEACACSFEGGNLDLATLLAGLAPNPVWLGAQVTAEQVAPAAAVYSALGAGAGLLVTGEEPRPEDMIKWIQTGWQE